MALAEPKELTALGFSGRKAEYVVGLARSDLDLDELASLPDEEVTSRLVALRGLGEWTADWFLARHLARPHAWPAGDLGLRKAVTAFYGDVTDVRAFASRFHPFENLSAHYLLTGLRLLPPA
jgi:DNA-3-methyladenine glycosylase II